MGSPTGYDVVLAQMLETMRQLTLNKPNDRSEQDRRYAVTITEMEKVYAYFETWAKPVVNGVSGSAG